jgi:hypothetical protein
MSFSPFQPFRPFAASRRRYTFDPDALTYLAAVETADTQSLEPAVRVAIDQFVKGCKADGIWDVIKASCILAGARTLDGCLVPLKGAAPTNVGGNFVSGDYDRKTGLKGNGTTKYLDSNRNNNADPQNSHHIAVWVTEDDTTASGNPAPIGAGLTQNGSTHIGYGVAAGAYFVRSRTTTVTNGSSTARATGLHAISRTSSTNVDILVPGFATSITSGSQAALNQNILIFTRTTSTPFWNGRNSFYSIGEAIDLSALNSRISTLMSALNSAIP